MATSRRSTDRPARLPVVVTPRSGRDQVVGWRGEELHVRVTAAPADGKANAAVCALIAAELGVGKRSVRVVAGTASRHKMLEADGVSADEVRAAFAALSSTGEGDGPGGWSDEGEGA